MEGGFQPFEVLIKKKIYQCQTKLGEGAFGKVYGGKEKGQNQMLAIKQIQLKRKRDLQKAEKEAELLLKIKKFENVIKIIDNFQISNYYYIITEFMAGGNLGQFIKSKKYLSLDQSAEFLQQIVLGIYEIHSRGIIHRDLKPDNILLSSDNQNIILKVTDFGLSNQQILAQSDVGSPIYSAPEQREKGQKQTYAVDIWSLGTILYEMITGYKAFPASEWGDLRKMWKQGFNYLIWPLEIDISLECKNLIQRMLLHEPQERISLKDILDHPFMRQHQKYVQVQEINFEEFVSSIQEFSKDSTAKSIASNKQEDQSNFKQPEENEKHKDTKIDFNKLSIYEQTNPEQLQIQNQVLQENTLTQNTQQFLQQDQKQKEKNEEEQFVMQMGQNDQPLQINQNEQKIQSYSQNNQQQQLPIYQENQNFQIQNKEEQSSLQTNSKEEGSSKEESDKIQKDYEQKYQKIISFQQFEPIKYIKKLSISLHKLDFQARLLAKVNNQKQIFKIII